MYVFLLGVVLASSFWSWELFSFNLLLFLLACGLSILLFLSIIKSSRTLLCIFCLILVPLLVIQYKTTKNANLSYMSIDEEYLFNTRRSLLLGRYSQNKITYMFYKFEQNLLRTIDLNLYFFGNHPRERPGIKEFEKFLFLFLPFFIIGLLKTLKSHPWQISLSFLIPVLELSIIGQDNPVGPFSLYPFFSVMITIGMLYAIKKVHLSLKL